MRDKISEIVINHHPKVGREHIGEISIEVYKYRRDGLLIDCGSFYNTVFVHLIIDSEGIVRRFIVTHFGKGLTQLRWLLKKLKDKDN